jgi:hypothetical protein
MALSRQKLFNDIIKALNAAQKVQESSSNAGTDPRQTFARELSGAIERYVKSADIAVGVIESVGVGNQGKPVNSKNIKIGKLS